MLNNVHGLRALAAALVVLSHIAMIRMDLLGPALNYGVHGVDLFFVISGFIMVHTTAGKAIGPGRFMLNRIVRIVPLYWGLTLALAGVALVVPALLKTTTLDVADLMRSLFFIPYEKSPGVVQPFLFLGWTLNYEMFFYVLFACSLTIRSLEARIAAVSAVLAAIVAAGQIARPESPVALFCTDPVMLEFAFGMGLGLLHYRSDFAAWPRVAAWVALAAALLWTAIAISLRLGLEERVYAYGIPSALIVLSALLFEAQGRRIKSPSLLLVGAASYSLYLSHPFVLTPVETIARRAGLDEWPALAGVMIAGFVGALVAAVLVYRLIELPIAHRLRGLTRGPGEARAVTE